jgi:DNA-binding transcriptional LysR family regulator
MERMRQPDAKPQHQQPLPLESVSWDDLRIFLACSEKESFRAAAKALSLDSATVIRRISRLEQALGARLFSRLSEGVKLTDEGKCIINEARIMERASFNILRQTQLDSLSLRGVVRIAITEGLGTYWMLPKLLDFQKANRLLTIEMYCTMAYTDISRLEADIAINFTSPTAAELIAQRIGYLHVYPFASANYVKSFGIPKSTSDLVNHRIIQQVAPLLDEEAYAKAIGVDSVEGIVGFRTNGSSAVLYAVERDAGIGFLPTYAPALGANILPIDIGLRHRLEIWMTYHPNLRKSPRHMIVIDWLKRIFDARQFPCFGADFIHPTELTPRIAEAVKSARAEGFIAAAPFKSRRPSESPASGKEE